MFPQKKIPFRKPGIAYGLDWSHPLAGALVGAWFFNEGAGTIARNAVNNNDNLTLQAGVTWGVLDERGGVCVKTQQSGTIGGVKSAILNTTPSALLKPSDVVSVFWAGSVSGDMVGSDQSNPSFVAMDLTGSPFVAYGFHRKTNVSGNVGNTDIAFSDSIGSHFTAVTNALSGLYNRYISIAQTLKSGSQLGYLNGAQVTSTSSSGSIVYTPGINGLILNSSDSVDNSDKESSWSNPAVVYIWNRFLSAKEIQLLHNDPYCLILAASPKTYFNLLNPAIPLTEALTDTFSPADALALGIGLIIGDTFSFADAIFGTVPTKELSLSDIIQQSDTQEYGIGYFSQFNDTFSLGDSAALGLGIIVAGDAISLSDHVDSQVVIPLALTDTFSFSDALTTIITGVLKLTLADAFSFADHIVVDVTNFVYESIQDGITIIDTLKLLMAIFLKVNDSLSLSDSVIADHSRLSVAISDALSPSDSVATVVHDGPINHSFSDTLSFGDDLSLGIGIRIDDSNTFSDAIISQVLPLGLLVNLDDNLALSDGLSLVLSDRLLFVQDSIMMEDNVTLSLGIPLSAYVRRYLNDVK